MAHAVIVPFDDVEELRSHLRAGSVILSQLLYPRYVSVVTGKGRTPGSRIALGRALARAGWQRKMIRRSRGSRGHQRQTGHWAWVVPGARPFTEEDEYMVGTLRTVLDGRESALVHETLIWDTYNRLTRQEGWRWPEGRIQLTKRMNKYGFARVKDGVVGGRAGIPSRLVDLVKVNAIAPPR